jgi:hypothetical protein
MIEMGVYYPNDLSALSLHLENTLYKAVGKHFALEKHFPEHFGVSECQK